VLIISYPDWIQRLKGWIDKYDLGSYGGDTSDFISLFYGVVYDDKWLPDCIPEKKKESAKTVSLVWNIKLWTK